MQVYEVEARDDNINFGYTTQKLGLHTDVNYYRSLRGLSLMHCVQ